MFLNRIRLPLYLKTPQFPTEANRFRLSNGESKTLSVTIRKNYTVITDYMSQTMHQRLVVALNHDTVNIEGDRYIGGVSVDGDYEITWPDFMDYPLGQAGIKIQVTPFDMTNDNCKTCDEMSQLSLVDDDAGVIDEGMDKTINVFSNDSICCFPIVAVITYFNTAYFDSVTIDGFGNVTLVPKNVAADVGSIVMAKYLVTCPDGVYDDADIYASINGSDPACEQPGGVGIDTISAPPPPFNIVIEWVTPLVDPATGYEWQLFEMQSPGSPVQTGTSAVKLVNLSVPYPATDYGFYVRTVCSAGIYSLYTQLLFTTPSSATSFCGSFTVTCNDGTVNPNVYNFSFMDCTGTIQNYTIINLQTKEYCMMIDEFNQPIYFEADPPVTYLYVALC